MSKEHWTSDTQNVACAQCIARDPIPIQGTDSTFTAPCNIAGQIPNLNKGWKRWYDHLAYATWIGGVVLSYLVEGGNKCNMRYDALSECPIPIKFVESWLGKPCWEGSPLFGGYHGVPESSPTFSKHCSVRMQFVLWSLCRMAFGALQPVRGRSSLSLAFSSSETPAAKNWPGFPWSLGIWASLAMNFNVY